MIVAGAIGADEIVLRDVARRLPDTAFVVVAHGPREVTLQRPAPNVFRFVADHGQGVAGLATHAYRDLGWRRAALVLGAWDAGWEARDAFAAEFCALGGRIASQQQVPIFDPSGADAAAVPRDVDGVAVFATPFFGPQAFLRRLARRVGDPARRIVVGPGIADAPALLAETGRALDGVTAGSNVEPARLAGYLTAFARTFPGVDPDVAAGEQVSGYRDAMEAVLRGIDRAGGDPARLPRALAGLQVDLLGGRVRLDADRQAVVTSRVVRVATGRRLVPLRRIADVDQSLGGQLAADHVPDDRPAACP